MARIMWCKKCKKYTLKDICPICGSRTVWKIPPKFSPIDRWGRYRRMMKVRRVDDKEGEGSKKT